MSGTYEATAGATFLLLDNLALRIFEPGSQSLPLHALPLLSDQSHQRCPAA